MNLEEMLVRERERAAPNPLADRTDQLVARVRRRRRARAATGGVVGAGLVVLLATVVWQLVLPRGPVDPARPGPAPRPSTEIRLLEDVPGGSPVEPGRYAFPVFDAPSAPLPVMSVPGGFTAMADDMGPGIFAGDLDLVDSTDGRELWVWAVDTVYAEPCGNTMRTLEVGPTAADLAAALAAQPMRAGTEPVAVSVGGYPGLYVEVSVPDDVDPADCPSGRFHSWPGRWQQGAGQVDLIWVVDVDGQRIVIDAAYGPGTSPDDVRQLTEMVATAVFVPSPSLAATPAGTTSPG